jgi:hypothetical protein
MHEGFETMETMWKHHNTPEMECTTSFLRGVLYTSISILVFAIGIPSLWFGSKGVPPECGETSSGGFEFHTWLLIDGILWWFAALLIFVSSTVVRNAKEQQGPCTGTLCCGVLCFDLLALAFFYAWSGFGVHLHLAQLQGCKSSALWQLGVVVLVVQFVYVTCVLGVMFCFTRLSCRHFSVASWG